MQLEEIGIHEKLEAEVVIIGGGGAGMAAALSATEVGCTKVVVLEKAVIGGNSMLAHDVFGAESPVQRRMGVDARRDEFFTMAMRWTHWSLVNPRIVRAFIDKSGDTIRWLQSKGLKFELGQYYVNQMPRSMHTIHGEGVELMKVLAAECKAKGVSVLTHTPADRIFRNEDGSIAGVVATASNGRVVIIAKTVIVTTGGYAANSDLLKKHCSYYNPDTMLSHGVRSNTGDGILMATQVGAATAGLGHIMFHGPSAPPTGTARMKIGNEGGDTQEYPLSILIREPQTLWVNKRGKRFIDEGHNLASFASATTVAQQPGGIMYTIFDDKTKQLMEEDGLNWPGAYGGQVRESSRHRRPLAGMPLPGLGRELRAQLGKGSGLKIADSLDEIATWIGAKGAALKATVDEYNAGCDKGHDAIFCKDRRYLLPLRCAPYYAIRGQAFICDTAGGIKINEHMEVLDKDDNPIPGLYAAGSTTGCWESANYCYELTGHLLGFALNSGRIAGENAARYTARE